MRKRFVFIGAVVLAVSVQSTTYYVSASRPNDTGNGTSWGTAKKTIQAAVDLTINGDYVFVTNGTYNTGGTIIRAFDYPFSLTNRVVVTNSITVKSINGPDVTVIEGSGASQFGTSRAARCVYMSKGILDGFTLQNGATFGGATYLGSVNDKEYETRGGGVNMYQSSSGTYVTNCIIRNCTAGSGGGAAYGNLKNCVISDNSVYGNFAASSRRGYGGGVYACLTLRDCRIERNTIVLPETSGSGYSTYGAGGGGYQGTYINCYIISNLVDVGTAPNGAAAYGGGAFYGMLTNCLVVGNTVNTYGMPWGAGAYQGTICNSTITQNNCVQTQTAPSFSYTIPRSVDGGGIYQSTIMNSIVFNNSIQKTSQTTNNYFESDISFSCTIPMPAIGTGNFDRDPKFVAPLAGDFRLQSNSICINSGNNQYVKNPKDLAGLPRIHGGTVDMGAYENIPIFTVSFNTQGGSAPVPTSITATNSFAYGGLAMTAKYGYSFGGWYTMPTGEGDLVTTGTVVQSSIAQTLYAKWTASNYAVDFNAQGGTMTPTTNTVTYGNGYGSLPAPTRTGYNFAGWYTNSTYSGSVVVNSTPVTIAMNHTLYARWSEYATLISPVPIPYSWLNQYPALLQMAGGNYEVAALIDLDLDGRLAWEEYVAGTIPTNKISVFYADIEMMGDSPVIAWSPDLGTARKYTVEGKTDLTDAAWGPTNSASRFFKVKVEMP